MCRRANPYGLKYVDADGYLCRRQTSTATPAEPGELPIGLAIKDCNERGDYSLTAEVFSFIRVHLAQESKTSFIQLILAVATADKRVSQGERHSIIFLAELLDCAAQARELFHQNTGLELYDLVDPSDAKYWTDLEDAQRRRKHEEARKENPQSRSEHQQQQSAGNSRKNDAARTEALAILGLVGNPPPDEIRSAYQKLARIHHPDRYVSLGSETVDHATRTFQRIQNAYATLTN